MGVNSSQYTEGMTSFETGAVRSSDDDKLDYEGFFSPLVVERFAEYMHKHRRTPDGGFRDSDNWQRGIPKHRYMKSLWRHFVDLWKIHRGIQTQVTLEETLCAIMFNVQGYLHEHLSKKPPF